MSFSIPQIPKDKLVFAACMLAIFTVVGLGSHFYKQVPPAPQLIIGNVLSLAGRGNLPPLNAVMARDGQLRRMVDDLSVVPAPRVFIRQRNVDILVAQILFRWAGADMAQNGSDGPYIDSRVAAFLRRVGSFPVSAAAGVEIDIKQAANLEQLWFKIFEHYRIPLLAQTAAKGVYGGGVAYNPNTDRLTITGQVAPDFIQAFEAELQSSKNSGEAMRSFLDFIDTSKGFNALSEKEQDLIMSIDPPKAEASIAEPASPTHAAP